MGSVGRCAVIRRPGKLQAGEPAGGRCRRPENPLAHHHLLQSSIIDLSGPSSQSPPLGPPAKPSRSRAE